jgi:hypothetical protein
MQNCSVFRAQDSKHLTWILHKKFSPNPFPEKSDGRSHLTIVHKVQYVCTHVPDNWKQWSEAALFARSSYISVDTVFITVKLSYNVMKRTDYFVLL